MSVVQKPRCEPLRGGRRPWLLWRHRTPVCPYLRLTSHLSSDFHFLRLGLCTLNARRRTNLYYRLPSRAFVIFQFSYLHIESEFAPSFRSRVNYFTRPVDSTSVLLILFRLSPDSLCQKMNAQHFYSVMNRCRAKTDVRFWHGGLIGHDAIVCLI